jgi:predicted Rossmann fold flavoprotein
MSATQHIDAIVLGAGAAGLMCAIEAGKRGRRVALIEHADKIGKKILISGGGRCNFTNLHTTAANFLSSNPHFHKSALARYKPSDFTALVEKHRIRYHEKTLGQLFCDNSAREIVEMLEKEARAAHVKIHIGTRVREVRHADHFVVSSEKHEFHAPALVVATGGLSIPKMGATSFGYDLARQFGLKIRETRPALVPLTFSATDRQRFADLAGVAVDVIASIDHQRFREKMLITHRGLSGPAILQISSYWHKPHPVSLDLAPDVRPTDTLLDPKSRRDLSIARTALRTVLPIRFADRWLELNPPHGWTNNAIAQFESKLHQWDFVPEGTEGYEKAEVTAGGVDTDELSAKTMESKNVAGLYFIGEVVDVTGHLGGFNFQWAWASGYSAGQAL